MQVKSGKMTENQIWFWKFQCMESAVNKHFKKNQQKWPLQVSEKL